MRGWGKGKVIALISVFILIGLAAFVIGGLLAGWDIIGWFSSKSAIILYVVLGCYAIGCVLVLTWDKITKLL